LEATKAAVTVEEAGATVESRERREGTPATEVAEELVAVWQRPDASCMDVTGTAASKRDAAVVKVGAANAAATPVSEAEGATVNDEELVVTAAPEGASRVGRPAEAEAENTASDGVASDDRSTTGTKTGADRAGDTLAEARKPAEPEGEPRSS
jgi:hypothetical protein